MLEGQHFQNAYVTRDVTKAIAAFRARAQIDRLFEYEGATAVMTPQGPTTLHTKLAFIWIGGLQYELIQPSGDGASVYQDALPNDDSLAFHHICVRVESWADFRDRVEQQPYPVVLEGGSDALRFLYLDTRALLGLYVEYTWMTDALWAQVGGGK